MRTFFLLLILVLDWNWKYTSLMAPCILHHFFLPCRHFHFYFPSSFILWFNHRLTSITQSYFHFMSRYLILWSWSFLFYWHTDSEKILHASFLERIVATNNAEWNMNVVFHAVFLEINIALMAITLLKTNGKKVISHHSSSLHIQQLQLLLEYL